jgi:hypothetical protein
MADSPLCAREPRGLLQSDLVMPGRQLEGSMMRIFADFQNGTPSGRVRLGCMGTQRDVERLGIVFHDGMRVVLDDFDSNVADGTVRWEAGEGWVAEIDWDRIRPRSTKKET